MESNLENIVKLEDGKEVINPEFLKELKTIIEEKTKLESLEKSYKETLLKTLEDKKMNKVSYDNFNATLVIPKDIITFDTEEFLNNEDIKLIQVFSTTTEEKYFDLEKFEKENKELYNQYMVSKYNTEVDVKKLEKTFPEIYEKYTTRTKSDKPFTLRCTLKNNEKK